MPGVDGKGKTGGSKRCVVGNCSNGYANGYTVYDMQARPYQNKQGWIRLINCTRSDYDVNSVKTTYVCDGHFDKESFDLAQLMQFNAQARTRAPQLMLTAVPVHKTAMAITLSHVHESER